jgi:hypothetical protein
MVEHPVFAGIINLRRFYYARNMEQTHSVSENAFAPMKASPKLTLPLSNHFFRFAAVCTAAYLAAQTIQEFVYRFWVVETPTSAEQAILIRLQPADRLRSAALLISFFLS